MLLSRGVRGDIHALPIFRDRALRGRLSDGGKVAGDLTVADWMIWLLTLNDGANDGLNLVSGSSRLNTGRKERTDGIDDPIKLEVFSGDGPADGGNGTRECYGKVFLRHGRERRSFQKEITLFQNDLLTDGEQRALPPIERFYQLLCFEKEPVGPAGSIGSPVVLYTDQAQGWRLLQRGNGQLAVAKEHNQLRIHIVRISGHAA